MKELLEKRDALFQRASAILDKAEEEGRGLTAEEHAEYEKLVKELQSVREALRVAESRRALNDLVKQVAAAASDQPKGAEGANKDGKPDYRSAFIGYLLRGEYTPELRALGTGTGAAGGYLVPEEMHDAVVKSLRDIGPMLEVSRVLRTTHGRSIPIPTVNETVKGQIIAENTQVTEQDTTFGQIVLGALKYTSNLVRVSNELLQDAEFNVAELLRDLFAERIGLALNEHLTVGTGSGQPTGIVTAATKTVSMSSLGYDALIDHITALNRLYRRRARWMFSTVTWGAILKLKDANNQPLFDVRSDTILGFPYETNDDLPDVGTLGTKGAIVFGDFSRYYARVVIGEASIRRLDERYADYDQVGFVAFLRADGNLVDTSAVVVSQE